MAKGIVTLVTDFGTGDCYVGAMKGVVLSINLEASLVDISHDIPPGDIRYGSYLLAHTCPRFPSGTTHLAVVDPGVGGRRRPIVVKNKLGQFVGPDNGLFTAIMDSHGAEVIIEIADKGFFPGPVAPTFHGRDIFAPVAAHLSLGRVDPRDLGPEVSDPVRLEPHEPETGDQAIRGRVIHLDRFGNIITNISSELLDRFVGKKGFTVEIGGHRIDRLSETYMSVPDGDLLALIGSTGLLEVSVNGADAAVQLGARLGDEVVVRRK